MLEIVAKIISILNFSLILYILKKKPEMMVKPSVWFAILAFAQIQLAATFSTEMVTEKLKEPNVFYLLTHLVPFLVLVISLFTFPGTTKKVWKKIVRQSEIGKAQVYRKLLFVVISIVVVIILAYLYYVPFTNTGFYQNFIAHADPLTIALARENSLKLIPSAALRYAFPFYQNILGVFAAVCIGILVNKYWAGKRFLRLLSLVFFLLLLMIGVMLPGARVPGVYILLGVVVTFFFLKKGKIALWKFVFGGLLIIIPASIVELSKYQVDLNIAEVSDVVFNEILLRRILSVPMDSGLIWVAHIEQNGYFGVAGIPKIAYFFGVEGYNVGNYLMNKYVSSGAILTGNLSVSYIFAYYCYFGKSVIPFLVVGPLLLDFYVYLYNSLNRYLILPAVISLNMAAMNLAGTEFFTIFLTYGFFVGAIFFILLHFLLFKRFRSAAS